MSIRKGITRIITLVIWLFLCIVFALNILHSLGPQVTYHNVMFSIDIFILGFYGVTVALIVLVDLTRPLAEQWWDPWDSKSLITLLLAIIAGVISFAVFSQAESLQPANIAPYLEAFVIPFVFVIGNYIILCWIMDGFRSS